MDSKEKKWGLGEEKKVYGVGRTMVPGAPELDLDSYKIFSWTKNLALVLALLRSDPFYPNFCPYSSFKKQSRIQNNKISRNLQNFDLIVQFGQLPLFFHWKTKQFISPIKMNHCNQPSTWTNIFHVNIAGSSNFNVMYMPNKTSNDCILHRCAIESNIKRFAHII